MGIGKVITTNQHHYKMKVYIEFDFPNDEQAHQYALDGPKYARAVENVFIEMRQIIKYGSDEIAAEHAEYWRGRILKALSDENIPLP